MQFKDYLTESLNKEYSYRVKIAADCNADHLAVIEQALGKYNVISVADFKRKPISENPVEFARTKGVKLVSEVCSTDVVTGYPVNPRILEVWLAVNLGLDHDRVLCYDVKEPRRHFADQAEARMENDKDRQVSEEDAVLNNEEQEHYEIDEDESRDYGYGEAHNAKFLEELAKIKAEKGADYFRQYPSKDDLMGDTLRATYDSIVNTPNMGAGQESSKEVTSIDQSGVTT
tara:strand:- start:296 stop:985 length:690 start_codon:yes stop_codon:yes gene_type:complete